MSKKKTEMGGGNRTRNDIDGARIYRLLNDLCNTESFECEGGGFKPVTSPADIDGMRTVLNLDQNCTISDRVNGQDHE